MYVVVRAYAWVGVINIQNNTSTIILAL